MARIECPSCGAIVDLGTLRQSAEEFCPSCDYPLFWARSREGAPEPDEESEEGRALAAAVRRRPGAAGRKVLAGEPCPVCQELNTPRAVYCHRCGADMRPPPPPPPTPAPEPVATPAATPPETPGRERRPWWLVPLIVAGAVLAAVQVVVLLVRLL